MGDLRRDKAAGHGRNIGYPPKGGYTPDVTLPAFAGAERNVYVTDSVTECYTVVFVPKS